MSKRPSLYVDIYSDEDDDDDDLLKDTSLFLRKKSPPAAASLVPPKSEEYHSPLGTADFTSMFRDASTIGQDVKLSLEERGSVSAKHSGDGVCYASNALHVSHEFLLHLLLFTRLVEICQHERYSRESYSGFNAVGCH